MDWVTAPRLGFDTETTGVNTTKERIVTCSLIIERPDGTQEKKFWLINPGIPIPEGAARVHGITTEYAAEHGMEPAVALEEIAGILADHMGQGYPAVAFNASYDFTLLEHDLARNGLPTLTQRMSGNVGPVLDPYLLDRSLDRYRRGKRRLEDLAAFYDIPQAGNFHDAEADVTATLQVLEALIERFPKITTMPIQDVENLQREADLNFQQFLFSKGRIPFVNENWPVTSQPPGF